MAVKWLYGFGSFYFWLEITKIFLIVGLGAQLTFFPWRREKWRPMSKLTLIIDNSNCENTCFSTLWVQIIEVYIVSIR